MDMKLIEQAIKENLPQAVGEILTKELLELKQLRDKIEDMVLENQNLLNINHVLKKENERLTKDAKGLEEGQRIVEEAIKVDHALSKKTSLHEARVEAFQKVLELQDQRVKDMKDVLTAVFKSPVYRSYTHGSTPLKNPNGCFDTFHSSENKETTVE